LTSSAAPQWFPPRDLLIHLPFDENGAPTVNKSSKPHHNLPEKKGEERAVTPDPLGFKDGTPRYVSSPVGQGVAFDGKLYFDAGRRSDFRYKSTSVDYRERFAISTWIYPEAETSGAIITKMRDRVEEMDGEWPRANGVGLFFVRGKIHFNMVREWGYDGLRVETERQFPARAWHHVLAVFDGTEVELDRIRIFVDGEEQKLKINQSNLYLYWGLPEAPLLIGGGGNAAMRFKGALDEVRIYERVPEKDEIAVLACADTLAHIAAIPARQRTPGQRLKLRRAYLDQGAPAETRESWDRLMALKEEKKKFEDSFPNVMVMQELPAPRPTFVLKRGAYDAPGERVERGVPAILPPLEKGAPNNRLGLARWLVDPRHPLTARVAVNRFWGMIFGTGIVKTTEDFGAQGERPSHPELLDFLATEFIGSGWNVKALLKTIVMSATYRQSSKVNPALQQRDPDNRLLARAPRLRLPAEMIRDQALYDSGLLVERLGGPSVKPYQPDGLYKDMAFSGLTGYSQEKGEGLWRRSLYTFWKRTVLAPNMGVFDASAREFCTVRETRTNTPLQSLNLMNDVTYVEAARMLAERMMKEGGPTPAARLGWAFRVVTSRQPAEAELRALKRNWEAQSEYFARHQEEATRLLALGERRNDPQLGKAELAAYAMTASLIFNLDEAITRQ
jgi:hypothetical protein